MAKKYLFCGSTTASRAVSPLHTPCFLWKREGTNRWRANHFSLARCAAKKPEQRKAVARKREALFAAGQTAYPRRQGTGTRLHRRLPLAWWEVSETSFGDNDALLPWPWSGSFTNLFMSSAPLGAVRIPTSPGPMWVWTESRPDVASLTGGKKG